MKAVAAMVLVFAVAGCGAAPAPAPAPADPLVGVSAAELFARGAELRGAGDYVRAEQYFTAARDRGHDEGQVVAALIGVSIDAARYQAALRHALPYLERNPEDWALRHLVGSLLLATGEARRARAELERTIASRPGEPDPHFLLAITLTELARPEAAAVEFRAYLELAPDGRHAAHARAWLAGDSDSGKSRTWRKLVPPASEEQP